MLACGQHEGRMASKRRMPAHCAGRIIMPRVMLQVMTARHYYTRLPSACKQGP